MSKGHVRNVRPLGLLDVLVALVLFLLLTLGLKSLFDVALPGLLKDDTLLQIQLSGGFFLAFWAFMGNRFFKPHIDLVLEREAKTTGSDDAAKKRRSESQLLDEQLNEALRAERLEQLSLRDKVLAEARQAAASRLRQADAEVSAKREEAKQQLVELVLRAETELHEEAERLAGLVVER
ncbi:MAG: hypothetical protein GXX85_18690, partial [Ignavibacteria bacterium]|nr:hypothetical protein [Ignavibacteria bacterium]